MVKRSPWLWIPLFGGSGRNLPGPQTPLIVVSGNRRIAPCLP